MEGWRQTTGEAFLEAYRAEMEGSDLHPTDDRFERGLLDLFLIRKAAYEVGYELAMRPDWLDIPLRGLLELSGDEESE